MKRIAQKFESFQEVEDEEYRYWNGVSASECIAAGLQMSIEGIARMVFPPMDKNLKQLLSAFNANHVKYVVIGLQMFTSTA